MCKPKILFFFIIGILFSACRPNYALLNEGDNSFYTKPLNKSLNFSTTELKTKGVLIENAVPSTEGKIKALPKFFPKVKVKHERVIIPTFSDSKLEQVGPKPKLTAKEKQKKKRKRQRFWRQVGSNMFIGAFFLGIAIVLSLVHLQSLAALFGLASILFLFFGLKKFFKKRKRQMNNPFKKKQ